MSAPRFNAMDWLARRCRSGNTAYATLHPRRSVTLNFDGDNVPELVTELRRADGEDALFAALLDVSMVRDHREAAHG